MKKFSKFICKNKTLVVIISAILIVLSFVGMKLTHINYDILVYLPQDNETIIGQNILTNDFHMGAYSIAIVDNMNSKGIIKLENDMRNIEGVNQVISLYDAIGTNIPVEMLPVEVKDKLHKNNTDLIFITFDESTSAEGTINAVQDIRKITDEHCKLSGMSSMVVDTMELSEKEIAIYIIIAVALCILILELSLDSYIVPILLLGNIGCAILFNLGSNVFFGEISYITKALVAVLQLGVTTDFSIFLYHSYEDKKNKYKTKEEAMQEAIKDTFTSVTGSSLTTIAGFLVLCFMQLTLGKDLGIVMAKGVLLGVITVLTLFPSLLLIFDSLIEKTKHKILIPKFNTINKFIVKHSKAIFISFIILLIPAYLANSKIDVYYKIDKSLPNTLDSIMSNEQIKHEYNIVSPEMILIDKNIKTDIVEKLVSDLERVEGVDFVLSPSSLRKLGITNNMLPKEINSIFENDTYQLLLLNSIYDIASDELNEQVIVIDNIVKEYDNKAIVAGEGPLMKDLIKISDQDFNNVNITSVVCIFIILFIVLRSLSLPFLLISAIEFAIFMNMGISYFGGVTLPFVAPIVLGTIQLGATIDYAILMTTTYLKNRKEINDKKEAMLKTLNYCGTSILVSGMCFFAATFGVGVYSDLEMVGSLCTLISRGAIISMLVVIMVLPSILLIFDKLIIKTTYKGKSDNMKKKLVKATSLLMILGITFPSTGALALTKSETVYSKLNVNGDVKLTLVNEQLINLNNQEKIEDYTELKNILNINNDDKYIIDDNKKICWETKGENIFYQGTTDKELPVKLNITYKLDGKELKLEDILGKSGNVEITFKYTNLDKHSVLVNGNYETMYTPFLITMGTMFDATKVNNITISNGKVISTGTKDIVVGISAPGLSESIKINEVSKMDTVTIKFDTTDFELPSIYSVITPKLIDLSDIDIFNKMNNLYGSINTLQESMNQIVDGSNSLKEGSNLLKNKLGDSIKGLSSSTGSTLTEEQLNQIQNLSINGVNSKFTDEYKQEVANTAWQGTKESLLNSTDTTVKGYGTTLGTSILINYLGGEQYLQDYAICGDQTGQYASIQQAKCIELATKMKVDLTDPTKIQENITDMMQSIYMFQTNMTNSIEQALSNTTFYIAENVSKNVAVGTAQNAALQTAGEVSKNVASSVADQVKDASIETVKGSLNQLYDGVNQIDNGINTLSNGLNQFNQEGINKITTIASSAKTISTRVESLLKLGENYESFSGKNNKDNGETKFILVVDGQKKKEEKKQTKKEEKKLSLWDRFINLFK